MSELTRRTFLKLVGGVGAGFALGSFASVACASSRSSKDPDAAAADINPFVRIDPDGTVTLIVSKPDMGQGTRTSMAMLLAEELEVDWSKIKVIQAPGNSSAYGGMGVGGSSSVRSMNRRMRQVGAGARMMLIAAAAKQWNADPAVCKAELGKVIGPNGQTLGYGALAAAAATMQVPANADIKLKDKSQWKILGKPANRVDNVDVVTGRAVYANDVTPEGSLYAVCLRPPAFGGTPGNVDDSAARKVAGVVDVFPIPSGIAVIGKNTWAALKGREALKVAWNNSNEGVTTDSLRKGLRAAVIDHMPMPSDAKVIDAVYELPYLAHATMEPMNAVADVRADSATVWTATQNPDGGQIASAAGVPQDKVTLNVTLLGGGFGRRFTNEWIGEAVMLSKKLGKPVKLLWSRECDMQHDHYRPMSHHAMRAAIDAQGNPVAWSHQYLQAPGGGRGNYGNNTYLPYQIPAAGMRAGGADSPVPTGPWRSVEHTQIILANECFIDELAHAAGQDPYEFRRKLIGDDRLKKVLETVAEKSGWGQPLPKGSARGIACFNGYGSRSAHVVELTVKGNQIKLDRVVCAVDVGTAVNPRGVEAQMQGACIDGLSTALKSAITIDKGGVTQRNWDGYEWLRLNEAPKIEVYLIDSGADFGGMGEVGYPSVAPAVANAVFAATGKRARKFPIKVEELV